MLSIYCQQTRPQDELAALIDMTENYPVTTLRKWHKVSINEDDNVYIFLDGTFEVRRSSDELSMFVMTQQNILGISSVFYEPSHIHFIARSECKVRVVPKSEFSALVTENNLWSQMAKVLAWYICLQNKRDDLLIARNAYTIIREFLVEINDIFHHHEREVNIYDYIQEYTSLARSTIVKILSELKKGNYIEVNKGKLVKISSLPERF